MGDRTSASHVMPDARDFVTASRSVPSTPKPSAKADQSNQPISGVLSSSSPKSKEKTPPKKASFAPLSPIAEESKPSLEDLSDASIVHKNKWNLIGDTIDAPRLGRPAPQKLTLTLQHKDTTATETHTFAALPHASIDWSSKAHIASISTWRIQILRRRGFPLKNPSNMFRPAEAACILLFHLKLCGALEAGHNIKYPGPSGVTAEFNNFFVGKVLPDTDTPRKARDETSIKGKLGHVKSGIHPIRDVMRKMVEGKKGGVMYVPVISEEEFKQ